MNKLKAVFYSMLVIFVLIMLYLFVPFVQSLKRTLFPVVAGLGILFFILGIVLIVMTIRSKVKGRLRKFLLLTGISASGILVSVLLHNLVYGLMIYFFGEGFWGGGDEAVFFILGLIVFPVLFLVGGIGGIWGFRKKKV